MKKIFFLLSTFILLENVYCNKLSGIISDTDSINHRLLFLSKSIIDEAYSPGSLILVDEKGELSTLSKTNVFNSKINSFFLKKDSVIIFSANFIQLYNIKSKQIEKKIYSFSRDNVIMSSRRNGNEIDYVELDYRLNKLSLWRLDSLLNRKMLYVRKINIPPTDVFFDIYIIGDRYWTFDTSGQLYNNYKIKYNIAFNDTSGEYFVSSTNSSICFLELCGKKYYLHYINAKINIRLPIQIEFNKSVTISPSYKKSNLEFVVISGKNTYEIHKNGLIKKTEDRNILKDRNFEISLDKNISNLSLRY